MFLKQPKQTQGFLSGDVLVGLQDVDRILAPGKGPQGVMVGQGRFKCLMGVVFTAGRQEEFPSGLAPEC